MSYTNPPKGYNKLSLEKKFKLKTIINNNAKSIAKMSIDQIQGVVAYQATQLMIANENLINLVNAATELRKAVNSLGIDASLVAATPLDPTSVEGSEELSDKGLRDLNNFLEDQLNLCKTADKLSIVTALQRQVVTTYILATRLDAYETAMEDYMEVDL